MARRAGEPREPWIMVKVGFRRSPKLAELPNVTARLGWVYALLEAKVQRDMGVFGSRRHLRDMVGGAEGRHVDDWIRVGLAHEVPVKGKPWPDTCTEQRCARYYADAKPGQVVIHDFRKDQRDPTNADRQAEWRERNGVQNGSVTGSVTTSSRALSLSLSPSLSLPPNEDEPYQVATPPEANDLRALAEELTGQPNVLDNVWGGLGEKAVRLARKHGIPAVEREWRRIAAEEGGMPELRQLVFGADEALNRIRRTPTVTESSEERDARELAELRAQAARNIAAGGVAR